MNQTSNYKLNQWVKSDQVKMDDFNADNAKIDAAIKAEADARAALAAKVEQKADVSALTALTAEVAKRGDCQIWTTSYTGNGKTGVSGSRSISFPKVPKIVFIAGGNGFILMVPGMSSGLSVTGNSTLSVSTSWSGSYVSWYGGSEAWVMMNTSGTTYQVIALLQAG